MKYLLEHLGLIIIIVFILSLLFSVEIQKFSLKKESPEEKRERQYNEGYNSALKAIFIDLVNPQDLYNQPFTDDQWDKGWKQACVDNGANDWDDEFYK